MELTDTPPNKELKLMKMGELTGDAIRQVTESDAAKQRDEAGKAWTGLSFAAYLQC